MLDKESTIIAVELMPELKSFVVGGRLYALVKKALYGLVHAARLWHETIRAVLLKDGFEEVDVCVFKKGDSMLVLYVDDLLLLSADDSFFIHTQELLIKEFEEITVEDGCLNLFHKNGIDLSMKGYIESILKDTV